MTRKKLDNFRSLTKREVLEFSNWYLERLPNWRRASASALYRLALPFAQGITLDRGSTASYRLTNHFVTLVKPDVDWHFEAYQHLPQPYKVIEARQHDRMKEEALRAMHEAFDPPLDQQLTPELSLRAYEHRTPPTAAEAYSLAVANAYLGYHDKARSWCKRFDELRARLAFPDNRTEVQRRQFLDLMLTWIASGTIRKEMDEIIESNMKSLGLRSAD